MTLSLARGFDGAGLKVKRAYRHINELKGVIDEIGRLNTHSFASEVDPNGGHVLNFFDLGETAMAAPLLIGDAVHNLRAAFDHVWLALHRETSDNGLPSFPFHETRKNLEDIVAKSPVKAAFPDVERLILDEVKPYADADGNRLVWSITKLDNIDKHNLIIPVIHSHRVEKAVIRVPGHEIHITGGNFERGALGTIGSNMPMKFENEGKVSIEILWPTDSALVGEPVLPSILNMAEATGKAVELFRKTFL